LVDYAQDDSDAIYGGAGFDWIHIRDYDGRDYVDCGPGGGKVVNSDPGDELVNCQT
jgi:hypothetical protein